MLVGLLNMKPIDKPWEQLKKAEAFIQKMSSAKSLDEFEEYWIDFLHQLERSWNKLHSHLRRSPKYQGWVERGRTGKLRKKDELLSYLKNARGAEEHTIADISKKTLGGMGIRPAVGGSVHIKSMVIENGKISIDADRPLILEFKPGKLSLLEVENRGRIYSVPQNHLGKAIEDQNPISLAKLGIAFYKEYFEKAEKHFVK